MAIDIRAEVLCSLGTIISGNIGDDYLQGSGLVKTQGSVLISGLITPAIGTIVTFTYVKEGVTRYIPRRLRVMSSFADPFRRTTTVELGCKLTYLSDLKDPISWSALSDPENSDYAQEDAKIVTLPIYASSIALKCLAQLGIVPSTIPLTNSFSVAEFDFSSGYVNILSDLLVSESYFGYLDKDEILQICSLNQEGGIGPVFTSDDIIDIGSIGVGQLPGEAVTVSYSTLKLKAPTEEEAASAGVPGIGEVPVDETPEEEEARIEEQERINWELVETWSTPEKYFVSYVLADDSQRTQQVAEYSGTTSSKVTTDYEVIKIKKDATESEEDEEALNLIGTTDDLPSLVLIGTTGFLTPEQQAEFESNPVSVLEEVWPDPDPYQYVADDSDKWVYTEPSWELNALSPAQQFDTDPQAVLSEYWPDAEPYDYVADGVTKWVYSGSEWQKRELFPDEKDLYEEKEVPVSRITKEYGPLISVASSIAKDRLTYGYSFSNETILLSETYESFTYDDKGNQIATERNKYEAKISIAAALSLAWADENIAVSLSGFWGSTYLSGTSLTERTIQSSETLEDYTKDVTTTYLKFHLTQDGQQQIAKRTQESDGPADTPGIIEYIMQSGLVLDGTTVSVTRKGVTQGEQRPPAALRINAQYAKGTKPADSVSGTPGTTAASGSDSEEAGDPNNGWRTESRNELELAVGSASAQRRIELSLPYAPDDTFVGLPQGPFFALRSDAPQKANLFGRTQNRLLLGNRNGMNLQLSPERIPAAPFDPLYVQASGLTGLYRVNSTNWTFDSNGIVASIDALFWGAVGGTGTFWFPVAPGIVTLPTTPPVVDGQMNATTVVLPYNETAVYNSRIRFITSITKFAYSLELLTVVPSTIRVPADVIKVRPIHMPAPADFVTAAYAPEIRNSFDLRVSNTPGASITANIPTILNSTDIRILAAPDFAITAPVPQVGSGIGLIVAPPVTGITLTVYVPQVGSGIGLALQPPAVAVTVTAEIPTITTV